METLKSSKIISCRINVTAKKKTKQTITTTTTTKTNKETKIKQPFDS